MEYIDDWIISHARPFLKVSGEKEDYQLFMRDEIRPIIKDPSSFYASADGIILYNKVVRPNQKVAEVKGIPYSPNEILGCDDILTGPVLICGTFMTFADIHLNRVPYSGQLDYTKVEPIESFNYPMDWMEKDIFGDLERYKKFPKNNKYVKQNARMRNRVYIPHLDYTYYIVQIADYDVDVIQHFDQKQKKFVHQGDRFSFIRWGSQCDVILPLRKDIKMKPLIEPLWHVKAGVDKIISFEYNSIIMPV